MKVPKTIFIEIELLQEIEKEAIKAESKSVNSYITELLYSALAKNRAYETINNYRKAQKNVKDR